MPRPRTVPDSAVLEAAFRVVTRLGPGRLTLGDVAAECGLSPATLVQRFGTKRGLLLALAKSSSESTGACFAAVRAAHKSPLAAILVAATEVARLVTTPAELANGMAFYQLDVSDPEFHSLAVSNSAGLHGGYRALVEEAVAAGELVPCDAARLARTISALTAGSLLAWAIHQEGTAEAWVRADVDTLLGPYRVGNTRSRLRPRAKK